MSPNERSTPALEPTVLLGEKSLSEAQVAAEDSLVGRRLKHFDVLRLIGRGGMGSVYLGEDTSLGRPVALKVLSPELAHDVDVVARFVREARAQARLRHPNVAQIYFIGEEAGLHFFAMEYLEGPSIDALLQRGQQLGWLEALEYALAAARGLRAALAEGFIHRDVKPSNLMLDPDSGLKILDFGLVKSMRGDAELTRNGAIIGSPLYIAPEQGRGEEVDHRADIYSLGCALYHMLTGRPPFTGPSPVGIIAMHVTDRATPVTALRPQVPPAIERVIERMMAKQPGDRYTTYDDLIAALEAARPGARPLRDLGERALALAIDVAPFVLLSTLLGLWVIPLALVTFCIAHRKKGQTLGKWLLHLEVVGTAGGRPTWKETLVRAGVFGWGLGAWAMLAGIIYLVHRNDRVAFQLGRLSGHQLALPVIYAGVAAFIFIAYMAGFLMAAFHPDRRALHDLVAGTFVRAKARTRRRA